MSVGLYTIFPKRCPTVFRVQNITAGKCVRVFQYPIPPGGVRDLMAIWFISEADIRHSLLKGELMMKILNEEVRVVESNIDLLQFDQCQKAFLQGAGVINGLSVDGSSGGVDYIHRTNVRLIGVLNGANKVFTVPIPDKFVEGILGDNQFSIEITHNGRKLIKFIDYLVSESGGAGAGTGYDTIEIISFVPGEKSKLMADYVIRKV